MRILSETVRKPSMRDILWDDVFYYDIEKSFEIGTSEYFYYLIFSYEIRLFLLLRFVSFFFKGTLYMYVCVLFSDDFIGTKVDKLLMRLSRVMDYLKFVGIMGYTVEELKCSSI